MSYGERVKGNLLIAIRTMRGACDRAEQRIVADNGRATQNVLHELVWGFANATSHIQSAMSWTEDAHEAEKTKATQP